MISVREEEWEAVHQRLAELQQQVTRLQEQVGESQAALASAQQRIAELEAMKTPPPSFVKANRPEKPKGVRKLRAPEDNHARRREPPTRVVEHGLTQCPDCQGRLSSVHRGRRRQVIELPPPPPVEVIEHQMQRGWCSFCGQWKEAPLDLTGQVLGQERIGVRLAATIATMRELLRVSLHLIPQWLATIHQVHLSVGGIQGILRRTAQHLKPVAEQIQQRIRASPAVFADETGWRENGRNGYIWEMGTPKASGITSAMPLAKAQ